MTRVLLPATLSGEDAARLRRRYPPPRVPRPVVVALVAALALLGLGWLVWSASYHASPPVSAQVSAFVVRSDRRIDVTLTVDRPDPSVAVACRVRAQAVDFQTVAEELVRVPAGRDRVVDVPLSLTTIRRATSASAAECSTI